ncbi:MAG: hypothetical protein M1826_003124 [Phylliscum demangeonii]|nr:MAG: hypothetical protein M1826_003124 [Phylliscum demangeonii]
MAPPAMKRRKISRDAADVQAVTPFMKAAARWNLEQDYERRPRKRRNEGKESTRLPVKTADGKLQASLFTDVAEESEPSERGGIVDDNDDAGAGAAGEMVDAQPVVPLKQQIIEAKEELARIAGRLNEDPEENAGLFRALSQYAASKHTAVKKLALVAQLAVYKDVIPGYRIQGTAEDVRQIKVSKEVRRHRSFEQALLGGYQAYLRELTQYAEYRKGKSSEDEKSLGSVAISCACALLLAVPHFNLRELLLDIVVRTMISKQIDADFVRCRETLEELFRSDEDGKPSRDAVARIAKMLQAREYRVDETVLNTFLHLRLLSEFSSKASQTRVDNMNGHDSARTKKLKAKKEFRTKKQRKLAKEAKVVEKEMREADATVGYEERDRMQAETLKLVFVAYFRILKARPANLMGAVLEGLAKYAHLINQEFFGDLLEVLKDLIRRDGDDGHTEHDVNGDNPPAKRFAARESLLCIMTAFALLQGQNLRVAARTLNLDLSFFVQHLYGILQMLSVDPAIERLPPHLRASGSGSASSPTTTSSNKINVQTTTVLLLRSLSATLLPASGLHSVPPVRIAAFTKQLMTTSLQLPEKSCLATLGLLARVAKVHHRRIASLWRTEEKRGDGVFDARTGQLEASNPFASTVWEGEVLRHHFCPAVRRAVRDLETNVQRV